MYATTWRWWATPPFFAFVTIFSAMGRRALALASVVTSPSAAMRDATRLPIIRRWWAAAPPKRRVLRGVPGIGVLALLDAQGEAPLVELLDDLVEGLLAEVGDGQQIVLGALDELADGVDLGPLQTVAGPLGQVELLDRQVEVGRPAGGRSHVAELEALGRVAHVGHEGDERAQRVARRGQCLLRGDGPVGLDVEGETVVVGCLLDARGLDREGHPAHRREDRVDGNDADRRRMLVALGRDVATALLDR